MSASAMTLFPDKGIFRDSGGEDINIAFFFCGRENNQSITYNN
jgi:hypothetical protein